MERTEVLEHMAPIMDLSVRTIDHIPATRIEVTPDMVTLRPGRGSRVLEMTPEGARNMAKFAELPQGLAQKIRPQTFGTVATELLARKGSYDVILQENQVVGFAKPHQYHSLNPRKVLQTIEGAIRGDVDYHRVMILPELVTSLEVLGTKQEAVVTGDMVQAGALVMFSPIGTILPSVQSYVMRLACTNGAVSKSVLREFNYEGGDGGEGDDVWHFFRQSVRDAYNSMGRIVNRWRQMIDENIEPADRAMILEAMIKEAGMAKEDAEVVRAMALHNPPNNTYDILNLLTYASSHLISDATRVRRAQVAAADFQTETEHSRTCPICQRRR